MTKLYKAKYQNIEQTCYTCDYGDLETVRHVALDCKGLQLAIVKEETDLAEALGFPIKDEMVEEKNSN